LAIIATIASCNTSDQPKESESKNKDSSNKPAIDVPAIIQDRKDTTKEPQIPEYKPDPNVKFDLKTSQNSDGTWGYSIWRVGDNHPYINQTHIPSVSGVKGFSTQDKAVKAGNFVISKLQKNSGMPRVSPQELDSLGVLK
jgi:hypothetical protein